MIIIISIIQHNHPNKQGNTNEMDGFISRLTSNENDPVVEDYFCAEHDFLVFANSTWFANISNYLDT